MHHDLATSADDADMRRYGNGDTPSANGMVPHIWGPPPKPRPFAAAMAWLMKSIIDGFAAYGDIICPCFVDLPDPHADHEQPGSAPPRPLSRQAQCDEASGLEAAPPPARGGNVVRPARWLAWLRPQPDPDHVVLTFQHERLDERTLRDIGMRPYQPDELDRYLERYMDHGGW